MDLNTMPGLVEDVSDVEELDAESGINALQGGDVFYLARNLVTRRGIAGSLMNGRGRILTGGTEVTLIRPVPAPQFPVTTAGKRVTFHGNVEENGETREGERMAVMEADRWRIWQNLWQLCRSMNLVN